MGAPGQRQNLRMSPLLAAALEEARLLAGTRPWAVPSATTQSEAERLLALLARSWPAPAVRVEPSGAVVLAWECGPRGWLELSLDGSATLAHSAVIDGDDFTQNEDFVGSLPAWPAELLRRLYRGSAPVRH